MDRQEKWDRRFLDLAFMVSQWSKDPSTKCGAVIVRPDLTICSTGFNGFPRGMRDDEELYANRELKYERVVHDTLNALLSSREPMKGYTLYTYPPGHGPTCGRCAPHVIQAGIARVVHYKRYSGDYNSRWYQTCKEGLNMYYEAGVELVQYRDPDEPVGEDDEVPF